MTIQDILNQFSNKDYHSKNLEKSLVIRTQGLSGSCVAVKNMSPGFDWYNNKIVIEPEIPLLNYGLKKLSKLQDLYLKQISSIQKNFSGKWIAKYKRIESEPFDRDFSATIWLYKKLEEELDN